MKDIITFRSKLGRYINGFIHERKVCGYSSTYEGTLARFDSFIVENDLDSGNLDEKVFTAWSKPLGREGTNTRNDRIVAVCKLADYMESIGRNTYHPYRIGKYEKISTTIPTKTEIGRFFEYIDSRRCGHSAFRRFEMEYPVMMRMYYNCGLRLNEAVMLKSSDVDIEGGSLYIRHSKGDKDRIVYPSDDFCDLLCRYDRKMADTFHLGNREWFFPGFYADRHFSKTAIDKKFMSWWNECFPSWNGRRPTVHSLRHAFVVHRIDDWVLDGNELKEIMPYLSRYLGHSSIEETLYYYHQLDSRSLAVRRILEDCSGATEEVWS